MTKSISVSCIYTSEIIAILKQSWNVSGGRLNEKYRSWNYWQPFSATVLKMLEQMHTPNDVKHY
ncbi:hypothetical protein [Acinetobacter cumulans]|uniref:hypothetical protein n=1 Tax=Acinetobacter cumulans TaxID=2136182 RepID=UPI0011C3F437|nr:hypothetical protein [Acinetobacter cumulans]